MPLVNSQAFHFCRYLIEVIVLMLRFNIYLKLLSVFFGYKSAPADFLFTRSVLNQIFPAEFIYPVYVKFMFSLYKMMS